MCSGLTSGKWACSACQAGSSSGSNIRVPFARRGPFLSLRPAGGAEETPSPGAVILRKAQGSGEAPPAGWGAPAVSTGADSCATLDGRDRSARFERGHAVRKLLVASQKGGVGKTTSSVNLAAAAALAGNRVLLLDADPLSSISSSLNLAQHPQRQTLR